jgi:dsRNA-specific ribonuclease
VRTEDEQRLSQLSNRIGLPPIKNRFLLMEALTHSSVDNNIKVDQDIVRQITHYSLFGEHVFFQDRFSFLGKAILSFILGNHFYKNQTFRSLRFLDVSKKYFLEIFLFDFSKQFEISKFAIHTLNQRVFDRLFEKSFDKFIFSIFACIYIDHSMEECVKYFENFLIKHFVEPKKR